MNTFLKLLGIILVIVSAIALMAGFATGLTNENAYTLSCFGLLIAGIVVYIVINKRVA